MATQLRNVLKGWFSTGKKPTGPQFSDWIDSFWHKTEDLIPAGRIDGLQELLDEKVTDAPADGETYGRKDEDWVQFTGGASETTDLSDMPSVADIEAAAPSYKVVLNDDKTAYKLVPATTTAGFEDRSNVIITFNPVDNRLTLTPNLGTIDFTTIDGTAYKKGTDNIVIVPIQGLMYIYYDNDGSLKQHDNPGRDEQYNMMLVTLPVSFISYNLTFGAPVFVGNYTKGRQMTAASFVKNLYDRQIYSLTGITLFDIGAGAGSADADARFGASGTKLLLCDQKLDVPAKAVIGPWNIGWFIGAASIGYQGFNFPVITDVAAGLGSTGRIIFSNNGAPQAVTSGSYVWYFLIGTNDITDTDRYLTFAGNNEYGNSASAEDGLDNDIAFIENNLLIKQGTRIFFAVLYQTADNKSNAVKANIVGDPVQIVDPALGQVPVGGDIPSELINGGDASVLHNHDSLYVKPNNLPILQWQFDADTTQGSPSSGFWKMSATKIDFLISKFMYGNGADMTDVIIDTFVIGAYIYIQDNVIPSKFFLVKITSVPAAVQGDAFDMNIVVIDSGVAFEAGDITGLTFLNEGDVTRNRSVPTIVTTVLDIDFEDKNDYKTTAEVAATANFSVTLSNDVNADVATIDLHVTNSIVITLPTGSIMQDDEDRWTPTPTLQLAVAGGTGESFELSLNKVGTKLKWILSQIFE